METRMWASLRAQTLARTVQGMMYYEAALRLLSRLEKVDPSVAEDLIKEKYSYVVAAQVSLVVCYLLQILVKTF